MKGSYQPTKREIFGEIKSNFKDNFKKKFTKDNFPKKGKKLKNFGIYFRNTIGVTLAIPYIIPTIIRKAKETTTSTKCDLSKSMGMATGVVSGILGYFAQMTGYKYLAENDHPEVLLLPLTTNVTSGVYEIGRKIYKNAKQGLIEKHNLEKITE